jgi:hypothetical protein
VKGGLLNLAGLTNMAGPGNTNDEEVSKSAIPRVRRVSGSGSADWAMLQAVTIPRIPEDHCWSQRNVKPGDVRRIGRNSATNPLKRVQRFQALVSMPDPCEMSQKTAKRRTGVCHRQLRSPLHSCSR